MVSLRMYIKAYAVCVAVFVALLLLVSFVPRALILPQVKESLPALLDEGDYPSAWPTMHETPDGLDSFSTSLSLNIAIHAVENPIMGAVDCAFYFDPSAATMADNLALGLNEPAQNQYFRYWHGYLALLVPLLMLFDILQIRKLTLLCFVILAALITAALGRKCRSGAAIALCIALLFSNLWVVAESTTLAPCFLVSLAATLYVVYKSDEGAGLGEDVDGTYFFLVGAVTVYVDFLNTPIVSLGLPLATYFAIHVSSVRREPLKRTLKYLALYCGAWVAGFATLWVTKWAIALMIHGTDVVNDVLGTVSYRVSTNESSIGSITRAGVLIRNLDILLPTWMRVLFLACVGLSAVVTVAFHKQGWWKLCLALLCIAALSVVWYCLLPNHSTDHSFFTYRTLCVSMYALILEIAYIPDWRALLGRVGSFARKK